jgi:phage gp36-like protein
MEASQQCPDIHLCLLHFLDSIEALLQQRLEQALEDEQFSGDPHLCARYLVALTRGVAVIERMYNDKARISDIYKTALEQMPFTENN